MSGDYEDYRIMRKLIDIVANIFLEHGAIIFGDYVYNSLIALYNNQLYFGDDIKDYNQSKYWNPNYKPETKDRCILSNIIDVRFSTIAEFINFMNNLKSLNVVVNEKEFQGTSVHYEHGNFSSSTYKVFLMFNFKNMLPKHIKQLKYLKKETTYEIVVNVVINENEPPFIEDYKLSNQCIVKDKHSIRLSNMCYKKLDDYSRIKMFNELIDMISEKKITFLGGKIDMSTFKQIILYYISGWKISGLDENAIRVIKKNNDDVCYICLEHTDLIHFQCGTSLERMCHECLEQYIKEQKEEDYKTTTNLSFSPSFIVKKGVKPTISPSLKTRRMDLDDLDAI